MFQFTGQALRLWLSVLALLGGGLGILLSKYLPGSRKREWIYRWRPWRGASVGIVAGLVTGLVYQNAIAVLLAASAVAWYMSRLPDSGTPLTDDAKPIEETVEVKPETMCFQKNWNSRPRFETNDKGLFVGRAEFLDRLTSHFISKGGGTILISGVRGVGKTALVDRALVEAKEQLQSRYWKETTEFLGNARFWHLINRQVRRTLLKRQYSGRSTSINPDDHIALMKGATAYKNEVLKHWWTKLNPVDRRIRRLEEASRWQLFVLKFSASDIAGALAEPGQESKGKPRINPEKLLRSLIRKLYITCHSSRQEAEARILKWSLCNKQERLRFFDTLETAYNKSISKSYKETISNSINDFIKKSQSSSIDGKMSVERVILLILCLALGVGGTLAGWTRAWNPLQSYIAGGVGGLVAAYFALTWTFKRSREATSDRARQAQFSYEYDYSLDQMQRDLESLVRILHPTDERPPDPYRCFSHSVIVFDELDKLEQADQQLDDVITHFKNFFTLSQAVFVFLTDHEFYEYLCRQTVKAQLARHYPPQHTFFTEKIYLRKPEFTRFREAFYGFADPSWLRTRTRKLPADPMLIDDLLKLNNHAESFIGSPPLDALTQLYINRDEYKLPEKLAIVSEFEKNPDRKNAQTVAQIWASQALSNAASEDILQSRKDFGAASGWDDAKAVSFLYYRKNDFAAEDEKDIKKHYERLGKPPLSKWEGVDEEDFKLSDLARALCFQTRNHYFDLYNTVYDYVNSYQDGAPVLSLENIRFAHEPRLWSRYQQLLEIAFDSARENHPSREYFNALLMESLYRAFDKRGTGESVTIGEILFHSSEVITIDEPLQTAKTPAESGGAQVKKDDSDKLRETVSNMLRLVSEGLAAPKPPQVEPRNGTNAQIRSYTARDAEKIDQAIIRLLRLSLEHGAISSDSEEFETNLRNEELKPHDLESLKFAWKDNSHSIIRSTDSEEHERKLVEFWDKHKDELNAQSLQLSQVWGNVTLTGEGARVKKAIEDLSSNAEALRKKRKKISPPDASALKANVGTPEIMEALLPRLALERIRMEEDADIVEDLDKPDADTRLAAIFERKRQFASSTRLRLSAVLSPRDCDCLVYILTSPVPSGFDLKSLDGLVPQKTYLFWYITGREVPDPVELDRVNFYYSPPSDNSAAKMVKDYLDLVSKSRLAQIIPLMHSDDKDGSLALRAGAEVLGELSEEHDLSKHLTAPAVSLVISFLNEARGRFAELGDKAWSNYRIDPEKELNPPISSSMVATKIIETAGMSAEWIDLTANAITQAFKTDTSSLTSASWIKAFMSATSEPNTLARCVLEVKIKETMAKKLNAAGIGSESEKTILDKFVPWLSQAIVDFAKTKNKDVSKWLSKPDWIGDLELQRRAFRSTSLPSTPVSAPDSTRASSKRRK